MSKGDREKKGDSTSLYESDKRYKETLQRTKDHRQAVRSGYGWNRWASENAKNTGNW